LVREAHHRGLGDVVVRDQRALDLRRAQPVSADVDHVVDAAGDPVVTVFVAAAAVAGEVAAREGGEVRLAEPIRIAEDAAHDAGPRTRQAEVAGARPFEHLALIVHHRRLDAEEGKRRRPRLLRDGARQRRDQDPARLRLPPGVDDGATRVADDLVVPEPYLGIDRLADRAQQAQALPAARLHRRLPLARDGADGDRKSTRLNSSHRTTSYAVLRLKRETG